MMNYGNLEPFYPMKSIIRGLSDIYTTKAKLTLLQMKTFSAFLSRRPTTSTHQWAVIKIRIKIFDIIMKLPKEIRRPSICGYHFWIAAMPTFCNAYCL
jgi:hypothetical protein